MTEEMLRELGYFKIRSEIQAYYLSRRMVKFMIKYEQRYRRLPAWMARDLLRIKKGAWVKYVKGYNRKCMSVNTQPVRKVPRSDLKPFLAVARILGQVFRGSK